MNIRQKPGGEPEIKLEAVEERALDKAAPVCEMIANHLAIKNPLTDKLLAAAEAIRAARKAYGRPEKEEAATK